MEDIERVLQREDIRWHQGGLLRGRRTPGASDVQSLIDSSRLLDGVAGKTVLDVGTTNGLLAFEAERRGASRVVATDVVDQEFFGFEPIRRALDSKVNFVRCDAYQLQDVFRGDSFDYVFFWGVLYHLRHPLLALDNLYAITGSNLSLETEVAPSRGSETSETWVRFYERDQLGGDATNWFTPDAACLRAWLRGSGFSPGYEVSRSGSVFDRMLVECSAGHGRYFATHTREGVIDSVVLK